MRYLLYLLLSIFYTSLSLLMIVLNPIHSLLLLINVFLLGSILLFNLNVEFFGLIFFMVYIGAIVVLFLFVVMMLDIKVSSVFKNVNSIFSYKNLIIFFIAIEFFFFILEDVQITDYLFFIQKNLSNNITFTFFTEYYDFFAILQKSSHLEVLGRFIYKHYLFAFLLSSILLYIAMVGAIVLTLDHSNYKKTKMQNASVQTMKRNIIRYFH